MIVFRLTILVVAVFGLAGCARNQAIPSGTSENAVNIPFRKDGSLEFLRSGGEQVAVIDIEIAETDSARARGLMQRDSLPPESGMLFIFEVDEPRTFWMVNTRISLDMVFVSGDSVVVDVARYVQPLSHKSTSSRVPARYVIEVPAGYVDSKGIVETDRVRWTRTAG
jgi:uncharacterized protein